MDGKQHPATEDATIRAFCVHPSSFILLHFPMSSWSYPLFVIRHGGGLASVVLDALGREPELALAVFTSQQQLAAFVDAVGLEAEPRAVHNDREFFYLLHGLKSPTTVVAFDSNPAGREVNARFILSVEKILAEHLPRAASPWDYPVYVLRTGGGYASIRGPARDQDELTAVGLFTDRSRAGDYRQAAEIEGEILELSTPAALDQFLVALGSAAAAVALNPTVDHGRRTAKWCGPMATLRQKYLPRERMQDEG